MDKSRNGRGARFITTGERVGGFIGWAFVIAIAVHAVFAPFFRLPGRPGIGPQEPYKTTVGLLATPSPTPPPTATPPPQRSHRQPRHESSKPVKAHPPRLNDRFGRAEPPVELTAGPMQTGNPIPPASAPPGPAATVAACTVPNREARTLALAPPEYPPALADTGEQQVQVAVTIAPDGAVVREAIVRSSGYRLIDRDALRVARETTYAPRIRNCVPVLGTYKYIIDYQSS